MYSGWEGRAGSVEAYRNTDATATMRFPGFGKEAVEWLLERRRIRGIRVDAVSLDHGSSSTFDVHLTVLWPTATGSRTCATSGRSRAAGRRWSSA